MVWAEMSFEEFQDGGHLGYLNGTILAILNLCVTVMLSIKFWLNPTRGLGTDVLWRIWRWPPWRPSWISEQNYFSNSESLCCCNASHHVLAQSHLRFGRRCRLKYFKMAAMAAILEIGTILTFLNLYNSRKPPIKFQLNLTYFLGLDVIWRIWRWPWPSQYLGLLWYVVAQSDLWFGRCHLKNFKMATVAAILDIGTEWF